jgi:transcriptional antiterminator RfaH
MWIVAQTQAQRENFAKKNLERAGLETYLPRIRTRRNKKTRIAPLFPRYLFVRIINSWYIVATTMGVTKLITNGEKPASLPDKVIKELRSRERGGFVQLPNPRRMRDGQRVRILRGAFKDRIAIIDCHAGMSDRERERVLLDCLGRKVAVELDRVDIELIK